MPQIKYIFSSQRFFSFRVASANKSILCFSRGNHCIERNLFARNLYNSKYQELVISNEKIN